MLFTPGAQHHVNTNESNRQTGKCTLVRDLFDIGTLFTDYSRDGCQRPRGVWCANGQAHELARHTRDRVQKGAFGACLMEEPELIAECVTAMQQAVSIPITVKNRIGIDEQDEEVSLRHFIRTVADSGCKTFIVHARKAWLKGLSPKQNRDVPPLNYDLVYRVKREFPDLEIIINGGVKTLTECQHHLQFVDGVMVGREAYHNPYHLSDVDAMIYNHVHQNTTRLQILQQYIEYVEERLSEGVFLKHMTRHILGLFQGVVGAKAWRRHISEQAHKPGAGIEVLHEAASYIIGSE